jgi:hypothetical protein
MKARTHFRLIQMPYCGQMLFLTGFATLLIATSATYTRPELPIADECLWHVSSLGRGGDNCGQCKASKNWQDLTEAGHRRDLVLTLDPVKWPSRS